MRLSWNEMRARAARFADEWKHAAYEKGETHSFYNEFFEIHPAARQSPAPRSFLDLEEAVLQTDRIVPIHYPLVLDFGVQF